MNNSKRLKEWLDANGNKVTLNNTASATTPATPKATSATPPTTNAAVSYKGKFKKVANQVAATQKWCDIEELTDKALELVFGYGRVIYQLNISISGETFNVLYQELDPDSRLIREFSCDGWWKVLNYLKGESLITNKSLCEQLDNADNKARKAAKTSTIDEFKLYESLWY